MINIQSHLHQIAVVDFDEKENLKMIFLNKNENFKTLILLSSFS